MNHSPACSAITARISSSPDIMDRLSSCHVAPAAGECLREILLHHAGGHPHMISDLLISQAISALENHGGAPVERELIDRCAQPFGLPACVNRAVQRRQVSQSLLHAGLIDVDMPRIASVQYRVLLH